MGIHSIYVLYLKSIFVILDLFDLLLFEYKLVCGNHCAATSSSYKTMFKYPAPAIGIFIPLLILTWPPSKYVYWIGVILTLEPSTSRCKSKFCRYIKYDFYWTL